MKRIIIIISALILLLTFASAELSFLAKYQELFSPMALEAADKAQLPEGIHAEVLTQFERELFELGYAAGYDAMREQAASPKAMTYVVNAKSKKFHVQSCSGVKSMAEQNKMEITCTREELIERGYEPCGTCKP